MPLGEAPGQEERGAEEEKEEAEEVEGAGGAPDAMRSGRLEFGPGKGVCRREGVVLARSGELSWP